MLPNSIGLNKNARRMKDFNELKKAVKAQLGSEADFKRLNLYYIREENDKVKQIVIDTPESFKEYLDFKKGENLKIYILKDIDYRPAQNVVERIQAKGIDKNRFSSEEMERKMNEKTIQLQSDLEELLTQTKNEFTKELNRVIEKVNEITKQNSKLKNYFEMSLYKKFKEAGFDLDIPKEESKLNGEKCSFCKEVLKNKGYKCGLTKNEDYYLCSQCNMKLSEYYPHNFIEII